MGFQAQTPREALFKTHQGWLPYVDLLALHMGVDLQMRGHKHDDVKHIQRSYNKLPYREMSDHENHYNRHYHNRARDLIAFTSMAVPFCELIQGESRITDEEPGFAIVEECDNTKSDQPAMFDVKFLKGTSITKSKSKTDTHGWSFQNEFKVGGSYGGLDFENTTTVGAHGEYERMSGLEQQGTDGLETNIQITVPAGQYYKVDQSQFKAKVEVVNIERCAFELAFEVYCHDHLWDGRSKVVGDALKGNKRIKRWGKTHSRCMFKVNSADDLYEILAGVSADYPNQRRNLLKEHKTIRECYEALTDKDRWSLESVRTIPFDRAEHGIIRIIHENAKDNKDKFIDPVSVLADPADMDKLPKETPKK